MLDDFLDPKTVKGIGDTKNYYFKQLTEIQHQNILLLKKVLADKDKEIADLKSRVGVLENEISNIHKDIALLKQTKNIAI